MLKRVGLNGLWTSPGLDPDAIDHVVCIPTFKRPEQLRRTLSSLATQDTTRRFALVIVDNDTEGLAGFGAAKDFLADGALGGVVLSEATRGNCAAINRAFGTARDVFPNAVSFLMIDDDEWAEPHWLEAMVRTAETTGADIVGGPVLFEFEDPQSPYCRHPLYAQAYSRSGPVPMIYGSGNCLIRARVFAELADPRFDMRFNFLGGGDTDFFTRCKLRGMAFHWCNEAIIRETVPRERTTFQFMARRSVRTGALNYLIDRKRATGRLAKAKLLAKNIAALPVGAMRSLRLLARYWDPRLAVAPLLTAFGRSLASVGIEPHQYGS